jgi:hypothetical protein
MVILFSGVCCNCVSCVLCKLAESERSIYGHEDEVLSEGASNKNPSEISDLIHKKKG